MKLVFAPRALHDLENIAAYLSARSPSGARNVLAAIRANIDALSHFPEIAPLVDDAGHRRLPIVRYPYVVFYRVAADELLVLHIRHTARRPVDPADL